MYAVDITSLFAPSQAYYDKLALDTQDYGEKQLQQKQDEIDAKKNTVSASAPISSTVYIVLGIAAVGLIGFAVLKKMHKI
jgi:hypothetical protein